MKKKLFIVLFLLVCLVPSLGILVFGEAQPKANEVLQSLPSAKLPDGSFNWEYPNQLTDYFSDRFALRQEMITLAHQASSLMFHETGEDSVIQGKGDWLFFEKTLPDYEGAEPLSMRQVWSAAHTLSMLQDYCEAQGIRFVFTIAPNKNSLYGEYMQSRYPKSPHPTNAARLAQALNVYGVHYVDLFAAFNAQDEVLYRVQDSHWTQKGAALAADSLLQGVQKPSDFYSEEYVPHAGECGDLYQMVYPTGTTPDIDLHRVSPFTFGYTVQPKSAEDIMIFTKNETETGSLLMFRDSFGNTLHPFMAEKFEAACFTRLNPYDFSLLRMQQPDTVVIELVERNISWLNTKAPILPSPERVLTGEVMPSSVVQSYTLSKCDSMADYSRLSGTIIGEVDADSCIYVRCNGKLYEAFPAGEGENPFTCYLPAAEIREISIVFSSGGQLIECFAKISK